MTSLKTTNHRIGSFFAVAALALATITPGLVPAFASAAQLSERSVALSSSSKEAEDVTYTITFKPEATAGAVVLNFCENSPLIGSACTPPAGFDASGATADDYDITSTEADVDNAIVVAGTFTQNVTATIELEGVTNPDAAGALFLRMATYEDAETAEAYLPATLGASIDEGSAAISITDTIGVSAAVLETLTFCVSGSDIDLPNCATTTNGGELTAPTVKLGDEVTGALSASTIESGDVFSQISTNATNGAVVNLKSMNSCGGLKINIASVTTCAIAPAASGIDAGDALFGITVATGAGVDIVDDAVSGTFQAVGETPFYSSSIFKLNYASGGGSGVTSPFGDPVLDTANAPANSKNAKITFGASISNDTPAGLYSNDFSLIATGKF